MAVALASNAMMTLQLAIVVAPPKRPRLLSRSVLSPCCYLNRERTRAEVVEEEEEEERGSVIKILFSMTTPFHASFFFWCHTWDECGMAAQA